MSQQLAQFLALLRRYPFASAYVLVTIACGGLAWFLYQDIESQEGIREDRSKEGEAMLELLVGGSTQRQELAAVREATRRIEENLIVESNLADNKWYFYKFEEQTKAHLAEVSPQNAATGPETAQFRRIPFTLRLTGTYEQLASFIIAIETGPRLVSITSFSLARRDRESPFLNLDLTVDVLGKKQ